MTSRDQLIKSSIYQKKNPTTVKVVGKNKGQISLKKKDEIYNIVSFNLLFNY